MKRMTLGLIAIATLLIAGCASDDDSAPASSSPPAITVTESVMSPTPSVTSPAPTTTTEVVTVTTEEVEPTVEETTETELEMPFDTRVTIDGYPVVVGGPCGDNPGMSVDDIVCTNGIWTQ